MRSRSRSARPALALEREGLCRHPSSVSHRFARKDLTMPVHRVPRGAAPFCGASLLSALLILGGCAAPSPDAGPAAEPLGVTSAAVCASASFSPSPTTAEPGTTVTWSATSGCDAGDTPEYEVWMQPPGGACAVAQPHGA